MRTVELLPDADVDSAVRAAWRLLADAGLPSQARHPHPTNRPHVTLAVVSDWAPGGPAALVRALAALPVPLRLGPVSAFLGRRAVLYAAVARTPALVELHRSVADALGDALESPHRPEAWIPHVTLARGLTPEEADAGRALLAHWAAPAGTADAARSYDTSTREATPLG